MQIRVEKENVKAGSNMKFGKAKDSKKTLKRLIGYLQESKTKLIIITFLGILSAVLTVIAPLIIADAIDNYISTGNINGLPYILLQLLGVYILSSASNWLQNTIMVRVAQKTVNTMRKKLFNKLQDLSLRFFDSKPHGEVISVLTNDMDNISNTLTQSVTQFLQSFFLILGITIAMFRLNWQLALITLLFTPLIMIASLFLIKRTKVSFYNQQKNLGELNGIINETISGQKVVKLFGKEQDFMTKFNHSNTALKKSSIKAQIYSGLMMPLMLIMKNLMYVILVAVGAYLALNGLTTIGILTAFISYANQFAHPLQQLANLANTIQAAIAGAERVFEVMDEEIEIKDMDKAVFLPKAKGKVRFSHVDFGYEKDVPVLKDISLEVAPGKTIALVGPTGSGKTTVINLLTRFYDIDSGAIEIDDIPIEDIQKESLRQKLGIVLQDTYLFSGTIKENIRYGKLDATDEEIIQVSQFANAHHFICQLPNGYDTVISEAGGNLSHGQKQLLAIARAILSNPDILILDEATSSVDTRTEIHIQNGLQNLMKGRTSFVIAHRLKTIQNADTILVLDHGEIIERGNHQELLQKKGFYYELYSSQFKLTS